MLIEFVIKNHFFSYTLEEFAQILDIPCEGACVFTDKWSVDDLAYGVPRDGPYQTNPPSPDEIILYIQNDREGLVTRTRHRQNIDVQDYQILTREIVSTLKPLEEIIRENIFCLGDQPSFSHLNDDDGNDEGTSRASTPSPTHFVNSLTNKLRDEHRGGLTSIGKGLKNLWTNMKKKKLAI
ncbi:hypothetical protein Tco_0158832 [Tanacetum coccineum]